MYRIAVKEVGKESRLTFYLSHPALHDRITDQHRYPKSTGLARLRNRPSTLERDWFSLASRSPSRPSFAFATHTLRRTVFVGDCCWWSRISLPHVENGNVSMYCQPILHHRVNERTTVSRNDGDDDGVPSLDFRTRNHAGGDNRRRRAICQR